MKTIPLRYLIVEKRLGVFMGIVAGTPVFANRDTYGAREAISFSSIEDAETTIDYIFRDSSRRDDFKFFFEPVSSSEPMISVIEMFRQGLGPYIQSVFESMSPPTETLH